MGGRPVPTRPLPKRPTHRVHTFRPPRSRASRAWSFPGLGAPRAALCVGDDEGLELGACVRILGTSSTLTYIREHSIVDPVGKKMELCSTNVSNGHDDHTHKLGVSEREAGVHTPPGGPRKDRAHPRSRHHCEGDQPRQLSGKFDGQRDIVQCKEGGFQQLVTKRHHHFTTGTPHRRYDGKSFIFPLINFKIKDFNGKCLVLSRHAECQQYLDFYTHGKPGQRVHISPWPFNSFACTKLSAILL
ncbi:PRELI domain containing protein 3A isoform X2 [Kogia breviceps]|uniref:PRELI domain containing protein 3A isoform X2 n=1 Tax=Kogia breviceps TaxID=27615 RepID=UPI0034D2AD1A